MEWRGLHASGVARSLGWSPSRVSRILSGKRGGSSHDVAAFMAICGVHGDERERLMTLSLDHGPGWYVRHHPGAVRRLRTLVHHERHATLVTSYHGAALPELLQTEAYGRAVLSANPTVPPGELERRVALAADRQRALDRDDGPRCVFLVHEHVLHTPVGGQDVMSDQLHALLRRSVRPTVSLRVVPRAAGAHAGMSGTFTLLDVREFRTVAYLEGETAVHFLETPAEVGAYRALAEHLTEVALDEVRSRELIATLATTVYGSLDTLPR